MPEEFNAEEIAAWFVAEEAAFRYQISEGACGCSSCMDALRRLGTLVTKTGEVVAQLVEFAAEAARARESQKHLAASVTDLERRVGRIEETTLGLIMGDRSVGALGVRVNQLEERCGTGSSGDAGQAENGD